MKNLLYLNGNYILFKKNNNNLIYKKKLKETILNNGKIINNNLFNKELSLFIKKNKLSNTIFTENITIIINDSYNYTDKYILKEILYKNNYKKVIILKESSYLKIENYNYINVCEDYFIIYYKNYYNKKTYITCNNDYNLIKYYLNKIKNKPIILFGSFTNIELLRNKLEQDLKIPVYIAGNPICYIINQVSKMDI